MAHWASDRRGFRHWGCLYGVKPFFEAPLRVKVLGFGLSAFLLALLSFLYSHYGHARVVPSARCPLPKQQGFMGVRNSAEIVLAVVPCNRSEKEHRQH